MELKTHQTSPISAIMDSSMTVTIPWREFFLPSSQFWSQLLKQLSRLGTMASRLAKKLLAPEARICGSTENWVIMVNDSTSDMTLFDRITGDLIQLPRISSSCLDQQSQGHGFFSADKAKRHKVHKAVLRSNPEGYVVMAIYGESKQLCYYNAGCQTWALLPEAGAWYDDIVCLKEHLFAVDEYGKMVYCLLDSTPIVKTVTERWFFWGQKVYLVGVRDYLCVVIRYLEDVPNSSGGYRTSKIKVYVLDWEDGWDRVMDLEKWTIFLGRNHSVALPANNVGVKADYVYFKDNYGDEEEEEEDRIFGCNLQDDSIEQLQCCPNNLHTIWEQRLLGDYVTRLYI